MLACVSSLKVTRVYKPLSRCARFLLALTKGRKVGRAGGELLRRGASLMRTAGAGRYGKEDDLASVKEVLRGKQDDETWSR